MNSKLPAALLFAYCQPGPSIVPDGPLVEPRPAVEQSPLTPHTWSEARNIVNVGNGQAQLVARPPERVDPPEAPARVFSPTSRVELAPSTIELRVVTESHWWL